MPRVRLTLPEASQILLVQELERSDPEGELLPVEERRSASVRCGSPWGGKVDRADVRMDQAALGFLRRRSKDVCHLVGKRHPDLVRAADWQAESLRWGPLLVLAATVAGFFMAGLGTGREFNLMALPVLLVLVWNAAIVLLSLASWFHPGRAPGQGGPLVLDGWLTALGARRADRSGPAASNPVSAAEARVREQFARRRADLLRPWRRARVSVWLHVAAASLALAGVAGLYHRGWSVEYRAVWESTLLGVEGARAFFGGLFRPASLVFNLPLPLDQLAAMQTGPGRDPEPAPALPWLHLYAATLVLFAVVPRALLAAAEGVRARRALSRAVLPAETLEYLRDLAQDLNGQPQVLVVLPYGYDPEPAVRDQVRALLHQARGGRVWIQYRGPVRYGDEESCIYFNGDDAAATVLLMNLASTPEDETHGWLVRGLRERRLMAGAGGGLLVLVDAGPFVSRLGDLPEFRRRLEERQQVWRATVQRAGLEPVFFGLPDQSREHVVTTIGEAWWEAAAVPATHVPAARRPGPTCDSPNPKS